jgi:hypothetical protein
MAVRALLLEHSRPNPSHSLIRIPNIVNKSRAALKLMARMKLKDIIGRKRALAVHDPDAGGP